MLFIFKINHSYQLYITFKSHLLNAFPICIALLYETKPKTIFQKLLTSQSRMQLFIFRLETFFLTYISQYRRI